MNLYKKILEKLYYRAFPENREKDLFIKQVGKRLDRERGETSDKDPDNR